VATRTEPILRVRDLSTRFYATFGVVHAVDGVSFDLYPGETLGIVGESGSGKSVTALSILRLVPAPGRVVSGTVELAGQNLFDLDAEGMRRVRGNSMATVFQNPMTALNPSLRIGWQLDEAFLAHDHGTKEEARDKAIEALQAVGIPDAVHRAESYPHEYSGGMRQRIVIAMGMMNNPQLLIADEPTTALDVTIQAQVMELMKQLIDEHDMALILITHNMGVVANMCDRVRSLPSIDEVDTRLPAIAGFPPDMTDKPTGCRFVARCPFAEDVCAEHPPLAEVGERHKSRCWVAQRGERFADRDVSLLRGEVLE
jgi:oligopeptide/dipeptide ABC transporter ATP-binding protein